MTSRAEAEQLLSSLGDNDLVEVGEDGNIYAAGKSPAGFINKPIVGIADQKGSTPGRAGPEVPGEARDIKVTRSLVIGADPVGGRLAEERRILALHFPRFVLDSTTPRAGTWAVARGPLRTFAGTQYGIWIDLPDGYPHSLPQVWPHGWTPVKNPHMYADGTICVMRRRQWSSFFSATAVVAKAAIWLNKYEIWVERQVWPGPQQPH